jgi:hypothetical protein
MAGIWSHRDIDILTFEDLLDAHELLDLKSENEKRYEDYRRAHQGYE